MTEEEKEIIETQIRIMKRWLKEHHIIKERSYARLSYYDIEKITNMLEKLQKENEEKDKIIFQVKDYVEPLITQYEDTKDYSIKEYCKNYIVNELLKGIFNKKYVYKGILREMITKPTIITDNGDYISIDKIIELLEEE